MLQISVPRKIFVPDRDKITRHCIKVRNEKLDNLYTLSNTIQGDQIKENDTDAPVAHTGEK
jgi:stalled ribosome rescue protein Dom34